MQKLISIKTHKCHNLIKGWLILSACIIAIFMTSCTSLKTLGLQDYPNDNLSKDSYADLNGLYSNRHDTIIGDLVHMPGSGFDELERQTILTQLFLNIPESYYRDNNGIMIDPNEKYVQIDFKKKSKAIVSFYHKDSLVFSKNINGKFKNGYFYLRPKIFVIPIVPLVFGYNFERTRIGKSGSNLLIDYSVNRWGFALVAGSSDKGFTSSIYRKRE
jgi:hypothetical protein